MSTVSVRRLAKNTLLLYFRMFLLMAVSLYTVRIVLTTLGMVDFGLYNVVGGVVALFAFMSNSMATSSQRYFTDAIGKGDDKAFAEAFRTTRTLYGLLALVVLVLAETIGLWFVRDRMVIPPDRLAAALWVYQFSITSFLLTITNTPYMAAIISHENMGIYAWVSFLEAGLKLAAAYLVNNLPYDKLAMYGALMFGATACRAMGFKIVCILKYRKGSWRYSWEPARLREMLSFTGWNLFGSFASATRSQGVNILLNLFFGPAVNASRGVAFQVNSAIVQFASNFTTALRPQIMKSYSAGQKREMLKLVYMSSRFTYLLMLVLAVPVLLETESILAWWLGKTGPHMAVFTRLVVLQSLVLSLSYSLTAAAQATGRVKAFQAWVGGFQILNLPVAWVLFRSGMEPEAAFSSGLAIEVVSIVLRLAVLRKTIQLPVPEYTRSVLFPIAVVTAASLIAPAALWRAMPPGLPRFLAVSVAGGVSCLVAAWRLGITEEERGRIAAAARKRLGFHSGPEG